LRWTILLIEFLIPINTTQALAFCVIETRFVIHQVIPLECPGRVSAHPRRQVQRVMPYEPLDFIKDTKYARIATPPLGRKSF
jgi:hypothetical protein